jgi:hypothetical protein
MPWVVMCLSPFWLGLCLLAVLSEYKLGGAWRVIGPARTYHLFPLTLTSGGSKFEDRHLSIWIVTIFGLPS